MQKNNAEQAAKVISAVCEAFKIAPKDINNRVDKAFLVPRQIMAYFLKKTRSQTLKTIRQTLGLVVDGQVYQYCARVKQLMSTNAEIQEKVKKIGDELDCAPDINQPILASSPASPPIKQQRQRQSRKSERVTEKAPEPKQVLAVIGNIYCTQALLTDPEPATTLSFARSVAVYVLWKECRLSMGEVANLLNITKEQIYTALGKASVSLEIKDELFEKALALVHSKL